VLQLIGDTDPLVAHLAALTLHRGLSRLGLEVRTLALATGHRGGLEEDVPAMAPNRRSLAARSAVRQESRWADVVVVHAPRALTIATAGRFAAAGRRTADGPPVVVAFWEPPVDRRWPGWSWCSPAHRAVTGATMVVAPSDEVARSVRAVHGPDLTIDVVPGDLGDQGRPRLDAAAWARILSVLAA
jgi:hypothetical protein